MNTLDRLAEFDSRKIAGEVLRRIEAHPEQHAQSYWLIDRRRFVDRRNFTGKQMALLKKSAHDWQCGTTACVAGFAVAVALAEAPDLQLPMMDGIDFAVAARALLGLNRREADWLFFDATNAEAVDAVERIAAGEPAMREALEEE